MFGRRLTVNAISESIIRLGFLYGHLTGVLCFVLHKNGKTIVAKRSTWYKIICVVIRMLVGAFYCYSAWKIKCYDYDNFSKTLLWIRFVSHLICTLCVLILQLFFWHRLLGIANRIFRLFRRLRALSNGTIDGFGGTRELVLLLFKTACIMYELGCEWPMLVNAKTPLEIATILGDMYIIVGSGMVMHICFMGYLSVGALYAQLNRYGRRELRRELRSLDWRHGEPPSRSQLRAVGGKWDECVAIYNEVHCVGMTFQRLVQLPFCFTLLANSCGLALVTYFIIKYDKFDVIYWMMFTKMFTDVALLILSTHAAVSSSRVFRHLSLDTNYMDEQLNWNIKHEIFLGRLNLYEFRVRPLGLFEVSNELILVLLSALTTYLTYIVQSGMQSNRL